MGLNYIYKNNFMTNIQPTDRIEPTNLNVKQNKLKKRLKTNVVIQNTLMSLTRDYNTPQVNNICSEWLLKYDDIDPIYRHFNWLLSKDRKTMKFGSKHNHNMVFWETVKVRDIKSVKTTYYQRHYLVCTQDNHILLLDKRKQLKRPEILKHKNLIQLIKTKLR